MLSAPKNKVVFIVGPTAIGKTEIAFHLAKKINAEIISCDSMQIYKGMDIVSSQPDGILGRRIPHYLVGVVLPTKEYNVSLYRKEAIRKMRDIMEKGKIPIFAGGSGLYMSVLLDGIFKRKSENKTIREKLYKEAKSFGNQFLYDKLKNIDPQSAAKIHPNDTKRMVRAVEVFQVSGKPISVLQKQRKGLADKYEIEIFCLNMERNKLYQRIEERINKMFQRGLVKEVKKLLKLKLSKTASCAIGIKELKGYFAGLYDLKEAKRLMIRSSRLYVKRQLTWFRKDKRIKWINVGNEENPKEVADRILQNVSLA